jgi:hypothetical protein
MVIIYLSSTLLLGSICLPISFSSITGTSGEQPSNADLCGISACKVYPFRQLPAGTVSSYLTFSPSPALSIRKRWAVIFCGTICCRHFARLSVCTRLFTGALLCAVRTFLLILQRSDNPACSNNFKEATAKIINAVLIKIKLL